MNNELIIGSKVGVPASDKDSESSYRMGTLVSLNSRFAGVELSDGTIIKVGKTKIEPLEEEKEDKPSKGRDFTRYESVRSASGRKSLDNGDNVALQLRGESLEFAYKLASKHLKQSQISLRTQYGHLNAGQQRMCLGNRLRNL